MTPSRRLLGSMAALFGLALPLGILPLIGIPLPGLLDSLWWASLLTLALAATYDALRLRRQPSPQVERHLPGRLPLGRWSEVTLLIQAAGAALPDVDVIDHLPAAIAGEQWPQRVPLRPGTHTTLRYRLRPLRRGHFVFPRCELHLPSPLGLWVGRRVLDVPGETRVYPDYTRLHGARLTAVDNWLSQLGVRQRPRRGLGQEFHQLRDFREGDTLRQIDWKATARKRMPIVREYQDERDQRIVFLLDCGRRMRSRDGDLSHFDHALEGCLLLAHVALRQGDAVGLSTFATPQRRFLAPAKGQAQLNALLNALYDLESTRQAADFGAAVTDLLARQRRRSLVVVVSNLRDEDDEALPAALGHLAQHHRVLLVSLREEVLDRLCQRPVERFEEALAYCGAVDYRAARTRLHQTLQTHRLPVLDCRPDELGPRLIERYLAWKKAGAL